MTSRHRLILSTLIIGAVFWASGCANTAPVPTDTLSTAQSALRQAESSGARETSPVLLNQARSKIDEARQLIDKEKNAEARRVLEEAIADARLAQARAQTEQSRRAAKELNETIKLLKEQLSEGAS